MDTPANILEYVEKDGWLRCRRKVGTLPGSFDTMPQPPVNGHPVSRMRPKATMAPGLYVIHHCVGVNGDAYLPIRVVR